MIKNKTLYALFKYKLAIIILTIVGFLTGFFVTNYVVNNMFSKFQLEVKVLDDSTLDNAFFISKAEEILIYNEDAKKYNSTIEDSSLKKKTVYTPSYSDLKKVAKGIKVVALDDTYILTVNSTLFQTSTNKNNKITTDYTKCEKTFAALLNSNIDSLTNIEYEVVSPMEKTGYTNPYLVGGILASVFFLGSIIGIVIMSRRQELKDFKDISDNEYIFKTPFHKNYWLLSAQSFNKVKNLAIMAVLFALMMACKAFSIPSGFASLEISITYLFFSVIACIYGPIPGLVIGIFSDLLGFVLFPSGNSTFFIGYTIDAMLAGFTYGIFLYKTKITFAKCLYARIIVNLFINVVLGSIWWAIISDYSFDAFISYMMIFSLPKNLIFLFPQAILLYILLKGLAKPMATYNLIDYRISENVSLI